MSENDQAFVRETIRLLEDAGIRTWLFGGWAEELLGLIPPRQHHDLDLLYLAGDFAAVDLLLTASDELTEIAAKHLPHKRAFLRLGIMTELILIRPAADSGWVTDFGDQVRFRWPDDVLTTTTDGLRVASTTAVRQYRVCHDRIHRSPAHMARCP